MMDLSHLKFDTQGLIPAVIQDWRDGSLLMLAYMNRLDGKDYADQEALGQALVAKYHLRNVSDITSCSTCHR